MVLHGLLNKAPIKALLQEHNHRNGDLSWRVAHTAGYNPAKRRASSRRLIFPRSVTGTASTIKTRFGTCQPLNSRLQNSNISPSLTPGEATTQAATSSFRRIEARPNTTAWRTPLKRSRCASTSAGFTFLPATFITSEVRPTIRNPFAVLVNRSSGTKSPPPSFASSDSGK